MDSKTKAIAARIPLEDYHNIMFDAQRLGMKMNDWLLCKIYGLPLIDKNNDSNKFIWPEEFLAFPDKKNQEMLLLNDEIKKLNDEIKKLNDEKDSLIRRYHKVESESSNKNYVIDKLEFLLNRYNKKWQAEYDDL